VTVLTGNLIKTMCFYEINLLTFKIFFFYFKILNSVTNDFIRKCLPSDCTYYNIFMIITGPKMVTVQVFRNIKSPELGE